MHKKVEIATTMTAPFKFSHFPIPTDIVAGTVTVVARPSASGVDPDGVVELPDTDDWLEVGVVEFGRTTLGEELGVLIPEPEMG